MVRRTKFDLLDLPYVFTQRHLLTRSDFVKECRRRGFNVSLSGEQLEALHAAGVLPPFYRLRKDVRGARALARREGRSLHSYLMYAPTDGVWLKEYRDEGTGRRHIHARHDVRQGGPGAGCAPKRGAPEEMGRFNEELTKAGVLLDLAGLHPSAEGVRVRFSGGEPTVVSGPFPQTKEIVAGYWILQVKSLEEAVEWAKRVPVHVPAEYGGEGEVEVRQIFEPEEFGKSSANERASKERK